MFVSESELAPSPPDPPAIISSGPPSAPPSPVAPRLCVRLCLLRSQFRRKTFPQAAQWYGLMSVCVSRWVLRFDRWLKLRLHTGHLCGDSSMCRILWTASVRDWQNPLPHSRHLKGFSLEWMYLRSVVLRAGCTESESKRGKKQKKRKQK